MNEYVGYSEPDKQYDAQLVFSFSLYMYRSYNFFYLKESTTVTTDKEQNEYNKKTCTEIWRTSRSQQYLPRSFQ